MFADFAQEAAAPDAADAARQGLNPSPMSSLLFASTSFVARTLQHRMPHRRSPLWPISRLRADPSVTNYPEYPQFAGVARLYDHLMADVPYAEWLRYVRRIVAHRRERVHKVLDLACGTGTLSELMEREGYSVVGVDISEEMIAEARRKALEGSLRTRYYAQDAASMSIPGAQFDLCVCLFDSLNYITSPEQFASACCAVARHLRPGGLFLFDLNSIYALQNGFFEQNNMTSDERLRYVWRSSYDPSSRLCTITMRFFERGDNGVDVEFRETHVQYGYSEEQVREMLSDAGFVRIETFRAYTLKPVTAATDRIFFVASAG